MKIILDAIVKPLLMSEEELTREVIKAVGGARQYKVRIIKGGPSSGHWGHAGRPGKIGGSLPAMVALSRTSGRTARARQARAREQGKVQSTITSQKFNTINHRYSRGVTASIVIQIEDDGKAIMKKKEIVYMSSVDGMDDSIQNEVMAYQLAERLDYEGVVPFTVALELQEDKGVGGWDEWREGEIVSVQQWVENTDTLNNWAQHGARTLPEVNAEDFGQVFLLDVITGNQDRHANNIIIDDDGEFYAIDNNRAFAAFGHPRNYSDQYDRMWGHWRDLRQYQPNVPRMFKVREKDANALKELRRDSIFIDGVQNTYGYAIMQAMVDRMDAFIQHYDQPNCEIR